MRTRAAALALLAACSPTGRAAPDEAARSAVADTITQKAALFAQMVNRRDAAAVMTLFADDRDMTYAENGMLYPSRDSLERAITALYGAQRELTFGWDELRVVPLASDAGVLLGRFHVLGLDLAGTTVRVDRGTWTGVFVRRNGRWVIVHAHESYPPPVVHRAPRRAAAKKR